MITTLIHSFKRPEALKRLVASAYGLIMINKDDTDMGVSAGRNLLVNNCPTPYCLILDDDCVFTDKTDLNKAVKILEENNLDILELDAGLDYRGRFETSNGTVRMVRGEPYDFVSQIFVARTHKLKECQWDERFKIGEHFAFFYKHKGKLRIGSTKEVSLIHDHTNEPGYPDFRNRAIDNVKWFMAENNITKRIDLNNEIITL